MAVCGIIILRQQMDAGLHQIKIQVGTIMCIRCYTRYDMI
jgi:hypothetical protein